MSNSQDSFQFEARHEALLRRQVAAWYSMEVGAPGLLLEEGQAIPTDLGPAFEIFLHFGELKPGVYRFANPWTKRGLQAWHINADSLATMPIPQKSEFEFEFTEAHARLLKNAFTRGWVIDPKRPYGDMTCFYIDMADILGEKPLGSDDSCLGRFSKIQIERYDQLHRSMYLALQAFLLYAKAPETGLYRRDPPGYGRWRR